MNIMRQTVFCRGKQDVRKTEKIIVIVALWLNLNTARCVNYVAVEGRGI